jgi:thiol-disulfide isomerase/thioredoxin
MSLLVWKKWVVILSVLVLSAPVLLAAEPVLELVDTNGKRHTPLTFGAKQGVVLIFVSPFCPTSNAFMPAVNELVEAQGDRFAFFLVEADAGIALTDAQKHAEVTKSKAPMLLDVEQKLVKLTQAKMTPEAVVLNSKGETMYQGRINDLYLTQTKKQAEPKVHDLKDALEAIAAGKPVANAKVKAVGCSITLEK